MANGFRSFRVADKVAESANITSFHLVPADGAPVWEARPGQYLTLRVPGPDGPVLKTYSISCDVSERDRHRITVKRETCPPDRPDRPEGAGSCWLHDQIEPGAAIEIAAPRGTFLLDETSARPVLLLAGGVGLTPLLAMLHRLAGSRRDVWFIHACENGSVHAMGDEVSELASRAEGRVRTHFVYRRPTEEDRSAKRFDSEGLIDKALLRSLLQLDDYDVYLCGPTPFMVAMFRLPRDLGVVRERTAYEFFGKAMSLEALAEREVKPRSVAGSKAAASLANLEFLANPDARAAPEDDGDRQTRPVGGATPPAATPVDAMPHGQEGKVVFARSGLAATWDDGIESLLELAENAGLAPEFSCRAGICNTCRCGIREGEVEYFEDPLDPPSAGEVLICCSRPKGRVVLEI